MPLFFLPVPPSRCPLLLFFTLSLAISLSLPFQNAGARSWSVFLTLKTGGVSHRREAEGEEAREEAAMAAGLCNMQNRALVAKVSGLRWGVSAARVHWCMNAAKSNASLDRQEGGWKGESGVPRESSCTSASRCYLPSLSPSLPPSITLPFLSLLFFLLLSRSSYLFISRCFFISNSVPLLLSFGATEEATALTRHSGHKERATEIKRRNAATQKTLAYPWGIPTKLIPNEPNPSFSPSSLRIPPTSHSFFFSPRPLPRCDGVLFINMCKSLFLSTRGATSTGPCRPWLLHFGSMPEPRHLKVVIELERREREWKRACKRRKKWKERWEAGERGRLSGGWRSVLKAVGPTWTQMFSFHQRC